MFSVFSAHAEMFLGTCFGKTGIFRILRACGDVSLRITTDSAVAMCFLRACEDSIHRILIYRLFIHIYGNTSV